jgi:hypothetical protein
LQERANTEPTEKMTIPHNAEIAAEPAIRQLAASYPDAVNRRSPGEAAAVWADADDVAVIAEIQQVLARRHIAGDGSPSLDHDFPQGLRGTDDPSYAFVADRGDGP